VCKICGLPKEICTCDALPKGKKNPKKSPKIRVVGKGREQTIIENLDDIDVENLASQLKIHCSCGGSLKQEKIILQGDHLERVSSILKTLL